MEQQLPKERYLDWIAHVATVKPEKKAVSEEEFVLFYIIKRMAMRRLIALAYEGGAPPEQVRTIIKWNTK